jgi:hypothetical protein
MRQTVAAGLLLLAGFGSAQAQVPLAPPAQDAMGKQFNPPPPGLAALYFYNPSPDNRPITVFVGSQLVGRISAHTWMRVELNPGWNEMRCRTFDAVNPTSITLAPGDIRFVQVEPTSGEPDCSIGEAPTEVGRNGVLQGSRAFQRQ